LSSIFEGKKKVKLVIEFINYFIFGEINLLHVEGVMERPIDIWKKIKAIMRKRFVALL